MNIFKTFIVAAVIALINGKAYSEITLEQVLNNPGDLKLNLEYAKQQEEAGKLKSTIAALERLNLLYPQNTDLKLYLLSVLTKTDSNDKVLELIEEMKKNPNLSADMKEYLDKTIKERDQLAKDNKDQQLALGQKLTKGWYSFLDLSYSQTNNSNIEAVSKTGYFYNADIEYPNADGTIRRDMTYAKTASLTIGKNIDENTTINLNTSLTLNTERNSFHDDYDLSSSTLSYSKSLGNNILLPYLSYNRQNYRAQPDLNSKLIGMNNKYILNNQNSLNYGFILSHTNYNQKPSDLAVYADYKSNKTSGVHLGNDFLLTPKDLFNVKLYVKDIEAGASFNSYTNKGISISYSHIFPVGVLKFQADRENNAYHHIDEDINSTIERTDKPRVYDVSFSGQIKNIIPGFDNIDKDGNWFFYSDYKINDVNSTVQNYSTKQKYLTFGVTKRFNIGEYIDYAQKSF